MSQLPVKSVTQDFLKTKMLQGIQKSLFFNQSCLNPDDPKCTPDEYFKEISYLINLEELYKVVDSCYYNDDMKYCPIFLQIGQDRIKQAYNNCEYLLQVWNMQSEKIFERPFQGEINDWAICYRYLIFTMKKGDEGSEYIHIIDLENENKECLVKNFGLEDKVQWLSYNNELLFAASQNDIQVLKVPVSAFGTVYDAANSKVRTINVDYNIQGFILNVHCVNDKYQLVPIETPDNQLDFNKLYIYNIDDDDKYSYKFEQYREVMPRKTGFANDPIIKNKYVFSGAFNFTVSLRKSGGFDLYWNMSRKESVDDNKYRVMDIDMTIQKFFFKMVDGNIYGFDHKNQSSITFQLAEKIPADEIDWNKIHTKNVQNIVKIYTGIMIVNIGFTQAVITHNKFMSVFHLTEWRWVNHVEFPSDILQLFRHYKTEKSRFQSILCKDGSIFIGCLDYDEYTEPVPASKKNCQVSGIVVRYNEDIENNHTFYITVKEGAEYKLQCLYRGKLQYITDMGKGTPNLSAACLQVRGDNSHLVIQNDKKFTLFQQRDDNGNLALTKVRDYIETDKVKGSIHSGTSYNVGEHMVLFDQSSVIVFKVSPASVKVYENIYCIGLQNFAKNFNYCICQDRATSVNPGLRLFDMETVVNKDKLNMMLLKKIDVGTQGYFEFGANVVRFAFISGVTHVVITPILHRNMNKFMGVKAMSEYICYKVIKDKFLALTTKGEIFTWNILTGKLLCQNKTDAADWLGDYELHSKYKKDAVILKSKSDISNVNTDQFFMDWQLHTNMPKQESFIKTVAFTTRRWMNIEIKNEKEVQINLEYLHPNYKQQWIFLNDKKDRMVVILTNYRTFFFKAVPETDDGSGKSYKIKWEVIRQISDYPGELENDAQRLEFFSPCFSRYLIVDKKKGTFLVKDTYTDQVLYTVPKDLMGYSKGEDPSKVVNRFKWLSANKFQIVNEDGYEKIIDMDDTFQELEYNYRPMFTDIDGVEWNTKHYYVMRNDLTTNDVCKRLKRKYQDYKTSYFLHNRRDRHELYQDLLTVDPHKFDFNEHSFTFLHWSLIEQLKKGEIKTDDLEDAVIEQILYNILPGGNTVLHQLCTQEEELIKIFKVAHPSEAQIKYHIPFVPNLKQETAIHKCIDQQDFKSIDTMLKYLKQYPIDHHSRGIKDKYHVFVEQNLPEFLNYLDQRFQQTNQLKSITKGCLKTNSLGIITSQVWFEEKDFKDKVMMKKPVETRIKCEFLDMPSVYHFNDDQFDNLFDSLANTDNILFFEKKAIQSLVDFNYGVVRRYVVKKLFYPFCAFMLSFWYFMNFIYERFTYGEPDYFVTAQYYTLAFLLIGFATYFVANEIRQLKGEGIEYLSSFWNYIDLIPPFGIYFMSIILSLKLWGIYEFSEAFTRIVLSIVTFFMWFKFLYFLRIFRSTGYLIRMIVEVIKDMRNFFLVLLITIAAFGDSMLAISQGNGTDAEGNPLGFTTGFIDSMIFTYRMVLGDFDTSGFGEVAQPMVMILFLLCTIFNMIVMLNLLIAIISDSYARVTANSELTTYQERAAMVAENAYLVPQEVKDSPTYGQENRFLLVVTDLEKIDEDERKDPVIEKVEDLAEQLSKVNTEITKSITQVNNQAETHKKDVVEKITATESKITDLKFQIESINKMLLRQQPKTSTQTKIHKHPLTKYQLFEVREKTNSYRSWYCDGKKFDGCKGKKTGVNTNEEDVVYHCATCQFDYCDRCFEVYGDTHVHGLERLTFAELKELDPNYASGWGCDGRHFRICPSAKNDSFNEEMGTIYHDDCGFDLCQECVDFYRS